MLPKNTHCSFLVQCVRIEKKKKFKSLFHLHRFLLGSFPDIGLKLDKSLSSSSCTMPLFKKIQTCFFFFSFCLYLPQKIQYLPTIEIVQTTLPVVTHSSFIELVQMNSFLLHNVLVTIGSGLA